MKTSVTKSIITGPLNLNCSFLFGLILCILTLNSFGNPAVKTGLMMYVSTTGNDSWSGRLNEPNKDKSDGPFATIERARNEIRLLKESKTFPKGTVTVEIQGGHYELAKAVELGAGDGGSDSLSSIIYQAQKRSEVRISGGKKLTKWEQVNDKGILDQLRPEVRGKIWQTNLTTAGITDFGSPEGGGLELFFNDRPMWISRYPNKGFIKITGLFNENPVDVRGTRGDLMGKFIFDDQRVLAWKNEKDAWVDGYWFWDWSEQKHKIATIDLAKNSIEVVPPYHNYGYRLGQWFYGFNLLSEIDEPGEYYVDREKGVLYFYPPSAVGDSHAYISLGKNILTLKNVSFLKIQGMILEGCRETVVNMEDCNSVTVAGCTIRNAGDWGVTIKGGKRNGVAGCDIYNVGGGGISIEAGDRKTLEAGMCFADNNSIQHIARIKPVYNAGISLVGVGNRASHNLIAHLPHMAVFFGGNDHVIEFNDISDVCFGSNDAGAIYAGRDWTMRGNIIRSNYLHNISGFEGKGCVGIYLDDAFSSADVSGNVFYHVTRAMMIGGGRDNTVINNIFIDCVPALHIDARGQGWMWEHPAAWIKEANEKGTILGTLYNQPPYSTRYPKLINILNDEPVAPKGNVISLNICVGGNWDKATGFWKTSIERKARPYLTMENNVLTSNTGVEDPLSKSHVIADPLFVNPKNPEKGKFQLLGVSPALKLGFTQILFDKIGLYPGDDRTRLGDSR